MIIKCTSQIVDYEAVLPNLSTYLAIIIQAIFSHGMLSEVGKGLLLVDIFVLLSIKDCRRVIESDN